MKAIIIKCPKCTNGVELVSTTDHHGSTTVSEIECRTCDGSGFIESGYLSDDLIDFLLTDLHGLIKIVADETHVIVTSLKTKHDILVQQNITDHAELISRCGDLEDKIVDANNKLDDIIEKLNE